MVLTDNLLAYYQLDEASGADAIDATGNGKTGTETGTVGTVAGLISTARGLMGGASNYFTSAITLTYNHDYSFSLWVKFNSTATTQQDILCNNTTGGTIVFGLNISPDNNFSFGVWKNGSAAIRATKATPATFDTSHWYHLVGTFNAATNKLNVWVDGVKGTEATYTNGAASSTANIYIGRFYLVGGSERHYLDEIGVWDKVLSDAEISSLYNSGNGLTYPFLTAPNFKINIGDAWKTVEAVKINIGDNWKDVTAAQINIGDSWKSI